MPKRPREPSCSSSSGELHVAKHARLDHDDLPLLPALNLPLGAAAGAISAAAVVGGGRQLSRVTLADLLLLGGRSLVLVFLPMAFACSDEAHQLHARYAEFRARSAELAIVTGDSEYALLHWASSLGLTLPLLSDLTRSLASTLQCPIDSHTKCTLHSVYVIDHHHAVRHISHATDAALFVAADIDAALAVAQALLSHQRVSE